LPIAISRERVVEIHWEERAPATCEATLLAASGARATRPAAGFSPAARPRYTMLAPPVAAPPPASAASGPSRRRQGVPRMRSSSLTTRAIAFR
jgi:hypothetical protein